MSRIKRTSIYFWVVLVLWSSIVELRDYQRFWSKIVDLALWLIITGLISFGLLQSGQFPPFAFTWNVLITYAVILFIARLVQGILSIPPRLYFKAIPIHADLELHRYNDDTDWNNGFQKVGIRIRNSTPDDVSRVTVKLVGQPGLAWNASVGTKLPVLIGDDNRLLAPSPDLYADDTIPVGREAFVYLAEIRNHSIWFLVRRNHNETRTDSETTSEGIRYFANYEIDLQVDGVVNGRPIKPRFFKGLIRFQRREINGKIARQLGWQTTDIPYLISAVQIIERNEQQESKSQSDETQLPLSSG